MASSPRVPCVQETARQDRYVADGFNATGTPQTVVDVILSVVVKCLQKVMVMMAPSVSDLLLLLVLRAALSVTPVPSIWFLNPVLLTLPMHGVLTLGANVTAPNTGASAEINFTAAGTTVITCVISSVTAGDSPVTETLSVTVAA